MNSRFQNFTKQFTVGINCIDIVVFDRILAGENFIGHKHIFQAHDGWLDLQVTLDESPELKMFDDAINSVKCICSFM